MRHTGGPVLQRMQTQRLLTNHPMLRWLVSTAVLLILLPGPVPGRSAPASQRPRVIIETDAGGDPDDEQSLVRFLLYSGEWDVEGIIATRPVARERENLN